MQDKILSIVIPTYNMEKFLNRCLDSLIVPEEYMQLLEVLIVNDGSKDSSSAIAHQYEEKYPSTFRVIDKENGNYGSCVNRGIDEATGKYFRILDADDRFDTASLIEFLTYLSSFDADMVVTNFCYTFLDKEDRIGVNLPDKIKFGEIYMVEDFDFIALGCESSCCMHALTFKLEVIKAVGMRLQTGISYTDAEYAYFPQSAVKTVLPLDLCLYLYTRGRENQTVSPAAMKKGVNDFYKVSRRLVADYADQIKQGHSQSTINNQRILVESVLSPYFMIVLCQTGRSKTEDERMAELYSIMKNSDPVLVDHMRKKHFRKLLYYFRVWEKKGKYMTEFPYSVLNKLLARIWSFLKIA